MILRCFFECFNFSYLEQGLIDLFNMLLLLKHYYPDFNQKVLSPTLNRNLNPKNQKYHFLH